MDQCNRGKVHISTCHTYDVDQVRQAIELGIDAMGGLDPYVTPGETILLKANLLMKKRPEEATTTHPVFMRALADILVDHGCRVIVGDSPGGPFQVGMLKSLYKACGYEEIFKGTPVILNEDVSEVEHHHQDGLILKQLTVIGLIDKVDKVISVSKLKTHGMMRFTGAVKNMFGIIPGIIKAEYHFKMPKTGDFADMLIDVCEHASPVLSFMDGIVGMEGEGPSAGDPREIGAVLVSDNPHHLDLVATELVGVGHQTVPTLERAIARGILVPGTTLLTGDSPDSFGIKNFHTPDIRSVGILKSVLPGPLNALAEKLLTPKPVFHKDICIGCGECDRCCPPKAITMNDRFPQVDLSKCIRCYCCQELCPKKAVTIHRPWLLKQLVRL